MEDGLTIPPMSHMRATLLIEQFCAEHGYRDTLKSLQDESGIKYEKFRINKDSELMRILTEHTELEISSQFLERQLDEKIDRAAEDQLFMSPTEAPISALQESIDSVHVLNVLSVAFSHDTENTLLASGSADKCVRIIDYGEKKELALLAIHNAGVTSLDFCPTQTNLLLSGAMDGVLNLVDINTRTVLQQFKDHKGPRSFIVNAKWSPNGRYFATASYDHSSCLYMINDEGGYSLKHRFTFKANVECIAFTMDSIELIVGVRGDNYLHYFDVESNEDNKINMNATGDDHVSFTPMDLSVSPNGKFLLVATDKDRTILFRIRTEYQLQNYYSVLNDDLSNPRLCWDKNGSYIYMTSQDNSVVVADASSGNIVSKLKGHTSIVRAVEFHPTKDIMVTGSYDKTLKLWARKEEK